MVLKLVYYKQVYNPWKQTEYYLFSFAALQDQHLEQRSYCLGPGKPGSAQTV